MYDWSFIPKNGPLPRDYEKLTGELIRLRESGMLFYLFCKELNKKLIIKNKFKGKFNPSMKYFFNNWTSHWSKNSNYTVFVLDGISFVDKKH